MIGFWALVILGIILVLACCGGWLYYGCDNDEKGHIIASSITGVVLTIVIIVFANFYLGTEPGKRMQKSWESETKGGIERLVTVYDIDGTVIKTYQGKFDVTYDSDRILFDDEQGKRHVIYYTTGTVTIDEK